MAGQITDTHTAATDKTEEKAESCV